MRLFVVSLAALAVTCLMGCGPTLGVVSGSVDYNGQPVERGQITLTPSDGESAVVGGPITAGRYEVRDVPPGPKTVRIEAYKDVNFAASSQEMMERARQARVQGDDSGLVEPADIIPANAVGNDQRIEVQTGANLHDFHLKSPPAKARG